MIPRAGHFPYSQETRHATWNQDRGLLVRASTVKNSRADTYLPTYIHTYRYTLGMCQANVITGGEEKPETISSSPNERTLLPVQSWNGLSVIVRAQRLLKQDPWRIFSLGPLQSPVRCPMQHRKESPPAHIIGVLERTDCGCASDEWVSPMPIREKNWPATNTIPLHLHCICIAWHRTASFPIHPISRFSMTMTTDLHYPFH